MPATRTTAPLALAAFALAAVHPHAAHAQFSITVDSPTQTISPGQNAVFTGTLTNTSATDTYDITGAGLNSLLNQGNPYGPQMGGGVNFGFAVANGAVLHYAPGASFKGVLFTYSSAGLPLGTYAGGGGTFNIQGQDLTHSGGYYLTSPVGFSVTVAAPTAAPEPASWAAFALSALGLSALTLRARRRHAA